MYYILRLFCLCAKSTILRSFWKLRGASQCFSHLATMYYFLIGQYSRIYLCYLSDLYWHQLLLAHAVHYLVDTASRSTIIERFDSFSVHIRVFVWIIHIKFQKLPRRKTTFCRERWIHATSQSHIVFRMIRSSFLHIF